ncbi:MAG TPA: helix-hairpin-helix domain-containing protein [Segetibacter sp.]|jgi:DNA polymerase (family 10)
MDNSAISHNLSLLAKLMDIHGDNSFKAKSLSSAAYTIDKLPVELSTLSQEKLFAVKGIGDSIGKSVIELIDTGRLTALDKYLVKTPQGILEMLKIKGLGPKKIATIWKDLEVESIAELLYACNENRLLLYKGFGEKTQNNIKEAIEFYLSHQGSYLYAQIESFAIDFDTRLRKHFSNNNFYLTGDYRRHSLTIDKIEWVTDAPQEAIQAFFEKADYSAEKEEDTLKVVGPENVAMHFYITPADLLFTKLFETSCSAEFFTSWKENIGWDEKKIFTSEEQFFSDQRMQVIPPFLRETKTVIDKAVTNDLPDVITFEDVKGIIHTHSDWSDGSYTIEQMAKAAIKNGYEYLVISDHSKTAYYANGLLPEKIVAQHILIEELNEKLQPFKIFKSIESDILNDGSLDYDDDILSSFDLVIASIHSNLKMNEEKAMKRLLNAIANPYTTILGHMTGRMLLSRNGYPVNYEELIEACAKHNVVIELNANPRRLDMDWKWIDKAIEKGVMISIDPDAHFIEGFNDIKYGVLAAQKGGLTKANNLSSFSLQEFETYIQKQKLKRS